MAGLPLPKLPGMTFKDPREPVKTKPQTLNYINGYPVPEDTISTATPTAPVVNAEQLGVAPAISGTETLPAWVAYDRKVSTASPRA